MLLWALAAVAWPAGAAEPAVPANIAAERIAVMQRAEKALAAGNAAAAADGFEHANQMVHDADAELGLARSYLQASYYRRALIYAAHTAGAHAREPEGIALYAWLLYMGGQGEAARKLLADAEARAAGDPVLARARRRIERVEAGKAVDNAPGIFAPYSLPPETGAARITGSGVLIDHGRRALAPLGAVAGSRAVWVRNGLGQVCKAIVEEVRPQAGFALLKLDTPLPGGLAVAERKAFPGSLAYAPEYSAARGAGGAWPLLRYGFLGTPAAGGSAPDAGFALPSRMHGGPVIDSAGALVGIILPASGRRGRFLPVAGMRDGIGERLGESMPAAPRLPLEEMYEISMRNTLQVIGAR